MVKSDKQSSLWCKIRPLISAYPDKLSLSVVKYSCFN